jgi:hypothetical protein
MHARPHSRFAPFLLALAACVRTTPQPPPQPAVIPPAFVVPEGCLAPLGGSWVHATDRSYRYEAEDDGGTLTLFVTHVQVIDAGFSPRRFRLTDAGLDGAVDAGPEVVDAGLPSSPWVRVELRRTASGFSGATLAPLAHPSGRVCEARFPTTVLSCDGGLLLETQSATALGDACQAPARPLDQLTQQHRLVRPDAG